MKPLLCAALAAALAAPLSAQRANLRPGAAATVPSSAPVLPPQAAVKTSLSDLDVLVYDSSTNHYARQAALNLGLSPNFVDPVEFDEYLQVFSWDLVLVDCPSSPPVWDTFLFYLNAGKPAVVSFWDWDNDTGAGSPSLQPLMDCYVHEDLDLAGKTLRDSANSGIFAGVTDPISDWNDTWFDDGDTFNLLEGGVPLAHVGDPQHPVVVGGNGGNSIAAFVIDDAGPTWQSDGSAVRLWENMILSVVSSKSPRVLVYDQDAQHELAAQAAMDYSPGGTVVADAETFGGHVAAGGWDLLLLDVPNTQPDWLPILDHVNGGGRALCSFWDWDAQPTVAAAFDVQVQGSFSLSLPAQTLYDAGTSAVFDGVTVPVADWTDNFNDDGDEFLPLDGGLGLAHLGDPQAPVMVQGNAGRTAAAFVLDEAGPTWLADGSGVRLWSNLIERITEPAASTTLRHGVLGLNLSGYYSYSDPVLGETWEVTIEPDPVFGTQTLSTILTTGLGGPTEGVPLFGYELLILPPYVESFGLGDHDMTIPPSSQLVGAELFTQAARLELGTAGIEVVLLDARDLVLGF
ncbi:MAG: hypothetical protein AAF682_02605 [Planctomycetota bacterium]